MLRRVCNRLGKKAATSHKAAAAAASKTPTPAKGTTNADFEQEIRQVEDVWNITFGDHPITKKMDFNMSNTDAAPMFNILDLEGKVLNPDMVPDLDKETATQMMSVMVRHNMTDRILLDAQRQGRISFYMTSFGEEATVVGSAAALQPQDYCFLQYREAALLQYRGVSIPEMISQCMGNQEDCFKGRQMPIHYGSKPYNVQMISSPLATQIPQAAGAGYAFKLEKGDRICVCYFGDGAASEGDFHAGANFASTTNARTMFFARNNGYAISTPTDNQYFGDGILPRGIAYGLPSVRVDGNDALAVYAATKKAREIMLEQNVPCLIEAMSYRVGHHSTSDDSTRYREKDEISHFDETFNPIQRFANYLKNEHGWWHDDLTKDIQAETRDICLAELKRQERIPIWPVEELFTDTFKNKTANLIQQEKETVEHYERNKDKYAGVH